MIFSLLLHTENGFKDMDLRIHGIDQAQVIARSERSQLQTSRDTQSGETSVERMSELSRHSIRGQCRGPDEQGVQLESIVVASSDHERALHVLDQ